MTHGIAATHRQLPDLTREQGLQVEAATVAVGDARSTVSIGSTVNVESVNSTVAGAVGCVDEGEEEVLDACRSLVPPYTIDERKPLPG
jgi:hypothetical protein